jgi:hypothetical protein
MIAFNLNAADGILQDLLVNTWSGWCSLGNIIISWRH